MAKNRPNSREENLDWLTTNCAHFKGPKAAKALELFDDDGIETLRLNSEFAREKTLVCNALATVAPEINQVVANGGDIEEFLKAKMGAEDEEEEEEMPEEEVENCGDMKVKNSKVKNSKVKNIDAGDDCSGDDQDSECRAAFAAMDNNAEGGGKKMSANRKAPSLTEYLKQNGTPEERAVWNSAVKVEREQRSKILKKLTANVREDQRKAVWDALKAKPLDELELLLNLRAPEREEEDYAPRGLFGAAGRIPDYAGAAGMVGNRRNDEEDDALDLPSDALLINHRASN